MKLGILRWNRAIAFWKLTDALWKSAITSYPFRRLCVLMQEMGAQTLILEEKLDASCREFSRISREIAAIQKRLGNAAICAAYKLTFLLPTITDASEIEGIPDDSFLGYAIIINVTLEAHGKKELTFIFESAIRESGSKAVGIDPQTGKAIHAAEFSNLYVHVKRTFIGSVAKRIYTIFGTYFCQQNTITSVCAHASAAMMINNCRPSANANRADLEKLITCEDINQELGIDHEHRMLELRSGWGDNQFATHNGLDSKELTKVFRVHGLTSYRDIFGEKQRNFREFLYGFIESGFPALLTFRVSSERGQGDGYHVVAVVGHTLNPGSWFPLGYAAYVRKDSDQSDRSYLSTIDWVDGFVVHDDGLGMQLCLPVHSFRPEGRPDPGLKFAPIEALGVIPTNYQVKIVSAEAEQLAWLFIRRFFNVLYNRPILSESYYFVRHLLGPILSDTGQTAVVRTQLVSKEKYLKHIAKEDSRKGTLSLQQQALMAEAIADRKYFWLVEISEPDLYLGDNGKVIDILIDPAVDYAHVLEPTQTHYGAMLVKLPGYVILPLEESSDYIVLTKTDSLGYCTLFALEGD